MARAVPLSDWVPEYPKSAVKAPAGKVGVPEKFAVAVVPLAGGGSVFAMKRVRGVPRETAACQSKGVQPMVSRK